MDFIDRIRDLAARIPKQIAYIQTEEATKNAFVMPFISALGYDVFNPMEVTPELNADIGTKKGEKVDYAILKDGKPIILVECKGHKADLNKEHASQLYRYFSVTDARFGILTNGIVYWFYTDLDAPNKMDARPFFEFNMLDAREQDVEELKKFTKAAFDLNGILTTASELKYTRQIKQILADQLQDPTDEFVKFFTAQVYTGTGRMSSAIREQLTQVTRRAFKQFINDQVNERLKTALGTEARIRTEDQPAAPIVEQKPVAATNGIVTTSDEWQGFFIVKAILREVIDTKRITMRDQQTYCGVLLDDNNRKPICRMWLNGTQKYLSLFEGEQRKEAKLPIRELDDLYQYAERLKATVVMYTGGK